MSSAAPKRWRKAVFTAALTSGLVAFTSTGSTAEAVRADLANLLRNISTGQGSKLFLLVPPLVCKSWSMLTDGRGLSAFPDLGPTGGQIQQMVVISTDGCPSGTAILVDASGVAASPGAVELREITGGVVIADSA